MSAHTRTRSVALPTKLPPLSSPAKSPGTLMAKPPLAVDVLSLKVGLPDVLRPEFECTYTPSRALSENVLPETAGRAAVEAM